jgi:RHS repeat-associated protein
LRPSADIGDTGTVDIEDLRTIAAAWLTDDVDPGYNADADLNMDDKIDNVDSDILAENWLTGGGRTGHYYYHYDGLGSVAAISDSAGDTVEQYDYDVYGAVLIVDSAGQVQALSLVGNPYFFTGRRLDDETGLYYYRTRYYHPALGRFLQTDPIGYQGGINLYAYCGNNPIILLDPSGLCGDDSWFSSWATETGDTITNTIGPLVGLGPDGFSTGEAWGAFAEEHSRASQGVVNALTGGLFDRESGIFYDAFNSQWEDLGSPSNEDSAAFSSGETGGRIFEVVMLVAAVAKATDFNPWLGKIAKHGAHKGGPHQYPHVQIMIRAGAHTTKHIRIPIP